MQTLFLDIPAGAWKRSPALQEWTQQGYAITEQLRRRGYDRIRLCTEDAAALYDFIETIILEECLHGLWQKEGSAYRQMLEPGDYVLFQQQVQHRAQKLEPQLRELIHRDLQRILPHTDCLNVTGYLQFSARRLHRMLRRMLQDEYNWLEQELEQEEFVELLRFFVSVQPPLLEEAHVTIHGSHFTLTDEWGNDLRQIYLDSLEEEEITGVSDNDLMMSILITLLPRIIYIRIEELPPTTEFLVLLQQVFGEQIIWQ